MIRKIFRAKPAEKITRMKKKMRIEENKSYSGCRIFALGSPCTYYYTCTNTGPLEPLGTAHVLYTSDESSRVSTRP